MTYIYPFWKTKKEDNVAIIGAGEVGISLYRYSRLFKWNKSVDWIDDSYEGCKVGGYILLVEKSDLTAYDKIILAADNSEAELHYLEMLSSKGILDDIIIRCHDHGEEQYCFLLDWYYDEFEKKPNKKTVKCKFVEIPFYVLPGMLRRIDNVRLDYSIESPDICLYGYTCGARSEYPNLKDDVINIGYWPTEPYLPDFSVLDYAFSARNICIDRNIYCRSYWPGKEIQDRSRFADKKMFERRFCNFISSNGNRGDGALLRKYFFLKLSEYKNIDAPGTVMNNLKNVIEPFEGNWRDSKWKFISNYKFTIAFENNMVEGYTTEKLFDPLICGSIPIYWGNPDLPRYVDKDCYINCADFDYDFDAVIEHIIKIDNDIELYMHMLGTSPMLDNYLIEEHDSEKAGWEEVLENVE